MTVDQNASSNNLSHALSIIKQNFADCVEHGEIFSFELPGEYDVEFMHQNTRNEMITMLLAVDIMKELLFKNLKFEIVGLYTGRPIINSWTWNSGQGFVNPITFGIMHKVQVQLKFDKIDSALIKLTM